MLVLRMQGCLCRALKPIWKSAPLQKVPVRTVIGVRWLGTTLTRRDYRVLVFEGHAVVVCKGLGKPVGWTNKCCLRPEIHCALLLAGSKGRNIDSCCTRCPRCCESRCISRVRRVGRWIIQQHPRDIVIGEEGEGVTDKVDKILFRHNVLGYEQRGFIGIVL